MPPGICPGASITLGPPNESLQLVPQPQVRIAVSEVDYLEGLDLISISAVVEFYDPVKLEDYLLELVGVFGFQYDVEDQ